ncbi:hypothetical protein G1C95_1876 [Bifidobacterium sp. DSM 109957]|uniref:Uncharacterized protein n=1 Tax=Bifidobacterium oedipodis TaxID=2675322 RepID=A0A7Y0EQP2_9BIFI|nr:hypothetical protein [Bifidobacterium sp. DSM 109957]
MVRGTGAVPVTIPRLMNRLGYEPKQLVELPETMHVETYTVNRGVVFGTTQMDGHGLSAHGQLAMHRDIIHLYPLVKGESR